MRLINHIHPTQEQLTQFVNNMPEDTPITMVNILKFKDAVEEEDLTGKEVYNRYAAKVLPFLKSVGGRMIWRGNVSQTLIGDETDQPHVVILVTYPSSAHFLKMITDEGYQKISKDRSISLEYGGLLATITDNSTL